MRTARAPSTRYTIEFIGNPSNNAAKIKAVAGDDTMLIAPDHVLAMWLPDALDKDGHGGKVAIGMRELLYLVLGGVALSPDVANGGVHFFIDSARLTKLFSDLDAAGFKWLPIKGNKEIAMPQAHKILATIILNLHIDQRIIDVNDVIYDGPAHDAGTGTFFDWLTPKALITGEGHERHELLSQLVMLFPDYFAKDRIESMLATPPNVAKRVTEFLVDGAPFNAITSLDDHIDRILKDVSDGIYGISRDARLNADAEDDDPETAEGKNKKQKPDDKEFKQSREIAVEFEEAPDLEEHCVARFAPSTVAFKRAKWCQNVGKCKKWGFEAHARIESFPDEKCRAMTKEKFDEIDWDTMSPHGRGGAGYPKYHYSGRGQGGMHRPGHGRGIQKNQGKGGGKGLKGGGKGGKGGKGGEKGRGRGGAP